MAGGKQPIKLSLARGGKHWTKEEIAERLRSEVQPVPDGIAAPSYLTAAQKRQFNTLADQLIRLGIMGETDNDALARYITAQTQYETATKELRAVEKSRPKEKDFDNPAQYMDALGTWIGMQTAMAKLQDRYFKQAQTAAAALGLTITSRCKLAVPKGGDEPKDNKFKRFGDRKAAGAG